MPAEKPQRADALRNREAILDAAATVLARDAEPSLASIAQEAGVSRATIYRHFTDVAAVREALMDEVAELGRTLLQEHLLGAAGSGVGFPERVVAMVQGALPIRTRYSAAMARDPVADAGAIAMFKPMVQALIKQAQTQSEVRPDLDPAVMAEALITTGFYVARRVHRDGLEPAVAVQVLDVMMRGMETSPRPAARG